MESYQLGERLRKFYHTWLVSSDGTGTDNPRPAALGTALLVPMNWAIFFVFFPYDTIPSKVLFWSSFVIWFLPTALTAWIVRDMTRDRAKKIYGKFFFAVGISGLVISSLSNRYDAWIPILFAALPGVLNGLGLGIDSVLLWKFYRGRSR
jgi:hypothetical protein